MREHKVLTARDVGGTDALWDLVRSGKLVALFGGLACLPESFTPLVRAQSLRPHLPTRVCVSGLAALWVWTGMHLPSRLEITYCAPRRTPTRDWARIIVRRRFSADQTVTLAGVQVFDPAHTLIQAQASLPAQDPGLTRLRVLSSTT